MPDLAVLSILIFPEVVILVNVTLTPSANDH